MSFYHERATIADYEWRQQRDDAETVHCEQVGCGAPPGEHCRNVHTGDELKQPAHFRRIQVAEQENR